LPLESAKVSSQGARSSVKLLLAFGVDFSPFLGSQADCTALLVISQKN
jgi:uncharacterized protein YfdQ (DUF2303 family)